MKLLSRSWPTFCLRVWPATITSMLPSWLIEISLVFGGMEIGGISLYPSPIPSTRSPSLLTKKLPLRVNPVPPPIESMILTLKNPWPWMPTSSGRPVFSSDPCSRSSWLLEILVPSPTKMPAGETSPAAFVVPGCRWARYIRSSKFSRLRLNAVVSAFAKLLAITSMRVERARSPVAAEFRAVIAMPVLSDHGGRRLEADLRGGACWPGRTLNVQRSTFNVQVGWWNTERSDGRTDFPGGRRRASGCDLER
ncbi:MAG: hypothetical protein AVDCRST_MAG64-3676 [uncultured Phycisphaerae bacterium]|uniref:Uncharacterized protein n=1 Tax=uncultured Phycisphaerae bacterium TaxID=904963 RepID=A0A6J4Q3N4_9BACT|nr:MAG: hypothetical protein AVDCRST_MAG64-3676 [uncultured Phycisphaerae bacterium]